MIIASLPRRALGLAARAYSTAADETLAGTVAPHRLYVLLHAQRPISALPSRPASPVQRQLQLALTPGALVNFAWHGGAPGAFPADADGARDEVYAATAYDAHGRIDVPAVSLANASDVAAALRAPDVQRAREDGAVDLYVCTHGARDCRCGDTGLAVFHALKESIAQRARAEGPESVWAKMRVGEVAHVGGHKYAANVLAFPFGDWLGNVTPENVPDILSLLGRPKAQVPAALARSAWWRGRLGHGKDEQLAIKSKAT